MDGLESYNLVKSKPTRLNRQLFIYYHLPYLATIIYKLNMFINEEDRSDLLSQIYLKLLTKIDNIDFNKSYYKLKGYIGQIAVNTLKKNNVAKEAYKRSHEKLIFNFEDTRTIESIAEKNINESKIELILKYARKEELEVIKLFLNGYTFSEIAKKKKQSGQWIRLILRTFGKRIYKDYRKEL